MLMMISVTAPSKVVLAVPDEAPEDLEASVVDSAAAAVQATVVSLAQRLATSAEDQTTTRATARPRP